MSSRRSCSSSVERQLPKLHRWVRLPSAAPKRKTRLPSCLSFWVPAAAGGLHPPGDSNARRKYPQNGYAASVRRQSRQRLRSEFRLRQGFRLRRKRLYGANAPPTRWPVGCIGQKSRKLENIDFDRPLQLVASDISLATSFLCFASKLIPRSFCCSSLPNRIRFRWIPIRFHRVAAFLFYFEKISILTVLYKQKDMTSVVSFFLGSGCRRRPPPSGDSNARQKYPQKGYAASVRRQSRQRLRSEFRLRQGFRLRRKRLYGASAPSAFRRLRRSLTAILKIQRIGVHRFLQKRRASIWMPSFFGCTALHLRRSASISSFSASTATFTELAVSSFIFWSSPAASRS
jgi:hypothetical protein